MTLAEIEEALEEIQKNQLEITKQLKQTITTQDKIINILIQAGWLEDETK